MNRMQYAMAALMAAAVLRANAGPLQDAGRKVYAEYAGAILPVTAVVRIELSGAGRQPRESTVSFFGTLVGEDGLTAISAAALSPLAGLTDQLETSGVQSNVTATQIKIRLPDGMQISARQIYSDEDLDIAFLLPEMESDKTAPKWPKPVIFTPGVAARVFDPILCLSGRTGLLGGAVVGGTGEINGVIARPRRFYLVTRNFTNMTGVPVFRSDGRPLGLAVARREPVSSDGRTMRVQQVIWVLPAEAVATAAEQARASAAKP